MSLNTRPQKLIFNTLAADSVNVSGTTVSILGLPPFDVAEVDTNGCSRTCPTACTQQVITITPTIPSTTCQCPYVWSLTVMSGPCGGMQRNLLPQDLWGAPKVYNVGDANTTLTVNLIVAGIVAQINSDPTSGVQAWPVGTLGSYTAFILRERDCTSDRATCGFSVQYDSGTTAVSGATGGPVGAPTTNIAHVDGVLTAAQVGRMNPILPHMYMNRPNIAYCGTYCVYTFTLHTRDIRHTHLHDVKVPRYISYEIWVNNTAATFLADWDTPLATALECLGAPLE